MSTSSVAPEGERRCLNCGAALAGTFCSRCGQRDIEPRVSVSDFAHELVLEHFGLDTKIGRTLLTLVRHPGRLTTEFFAGRRVRYVPPLRLYLWLSVAFFLLSALSGQDELKVGRTTRRGKGTAVDTVYTMSGPRPAPITRNSAATGDSTRSTRDDSAAHARKMEKLDSVNRPRFLTDTLHSGAILRFVKRRTNERIDELAANDQSAMQHFTESFWHHMPDALFLLVPMFALLLTMLYYGQHRYYAEHLVFALHFQAFVFAMFIIALLPIPGIDAIAFFGSFVYAFMALRTVYGESRLRTAGKMAVLSAGYLVCVAVVMSLLTAVVFLFA
jgi:hypothetical protein